MLRRIHLAAAGAALALVVPADAFGAGQLVVQNSGEVQYYGDDGANVVTLTTPQVTPTSFTVKFDEPGITEGLDTNDICKPTADGATCVISRTQEVELHGGDGDDRLTVGTEALPYAALFGDDGDDRIVGSGIGEYIDGGPDDDEIDGNGGTDYFAGSDGVDVTRGGADDDVALADPGDGDRIDLGGGRDFIFAGNDDGTGDVLVGGSGVDALLFYSVGAPGSAPHATINLAERTATWQAFAPHPAIRDSLDGFEDAGEYFGDSGDDTLIGDDRPNVLAGGTGSDTLAGGSGTDTILGDRGFAGPDYTYFSETPGNDSIDALDGFEDRVECGAGDDNVIGDQFDLTTLSACEAVDGRQANPFGIAPPPDPAAPVVPAPVPPGGGGTDGPRQLDVRAPRCPAPKLPTQKRATFVKRGFAVELRCDEPARVAVSAIVSVKRASRSLTLSRAGDLVLGDVTATVDARTRSVRFKVPRRLRRALGKRFSVRLRLDATDAAGNRSTELATFKVR